MGLCFYLRYTEKRLELESSPPLSPVLVALPACSRSHNNYAPCFFLFIGPNPVHFLRPKACYMYIYLYLYLYPLKTAKLFLMPPAAAS